MYHRSILFIVIFLALISFTAAALGDTKPSSPDTASAAVDSSKAFIDHDFSWLIKHEIVTISSAVIFFFFAFILIIFLRQPLLSLADSHPRYSKSLKQIVSIFLITCSVLIIYISVQHILELSQTSSLIMLVIIGFAVIISFQDILKDVIAGLILPFQKHLEVGCKIGGTGYWGEIIRIGLRDVEIKKADGRIAIIPISAIMKEALMEIYCEKENCPITINFYLPLDADLEQSRKMTYKAAIVSPYLYLKKPVMIVFMTELENGHPIIKMELSAYLQKIDFQPLFINDMTTSMISILKENKRIPA